MLWCRQVLQRSWQASDAILNLRRSFGFQRLNILRQKAPAPTLPPVKPAAEVKDMIIFRYENPRFFKILNVFALTQLAFWSVLCSSSFSMLNTPVPEKKKEDAKEAEDLPFWRKINLGQDKYKYGMAAGTFLMGYVILVVSWTYILRSVRLLVLRKDGKHVSFVTYAPFGKNRILDVPLNDVSAIGSRTGGTTQMPVKVKNKWFFYIFDLKKGEFPRPELFDRTVGISRRF